MLENTILDRPPGQTPSSSAPGPSISATATVSILETMYPHMKTYVATISGRSPVMTTSGRGGFYGDWLSYQIQRLGRQIGFDQQGSDRHGLYGLLDRG